jgi:hypothetical protein
MSGLSKKQNNERKTGRWRERDSGQDRKEVQEISEDTENRNQGERTEIKEGGRKGSKIKGNTGVKKEGKEDRGARLRETQE